MKTFFESGIMKEVPYFINGSGTFYIQELKDADFDKYVYSGDSIKYELDTELVSLYDKFRDLFFEDTDAYYLVVPRNCYYCVPRNQMPNFVVPISPKGALLLLPIEEVQKNDGGCAVIDDPMQIELLNVFALKYEYMFNADFVASNCRKELEILKDYQEKNKVVLNALRTVNR